MTARHAATDALDVIVVGGGPAGLAAAGELRRRGVGQVVVLEREREPGGIPRHTDHLGFGWPDRRRMMKGPAYAAKAAAEIEERGAELKLSSTVLEIGHLHDGSIPVAVATPGGVEHLRARAVVLATGTRERPRAARLVPGDRPAGVHTTGSVQQLARAGIAIGSRAVVVGAEHVSFSAVMTLAHTRCRTAAVVTALPRHQTYRSLRWLAAGRHRVPVLTGAIVAEIAGRDGRVDAVVLADGRRIECDTVVFTGDWIPDHELARRTGVDIDGATRGPRVDADLRTSELGVFAAGNLLHGAETAGVCALDGRHVAGSIVQWLDHAVWPAATVPLTATAPLVWISPSALSVPTPGTSSAQSRDAPSVPPRGRFLLRVAQDLARRAKIVVRQGDHVLWTGSPEGDPRPNRSCWIPSTWVGAVDPGTNLPVVAGVA